MIETLTFSDLIYCYWEAVTEIVEGGEVSSPVYQEYMFYGIQIGPYDYDEAKEILYP